MRPWSPARARSAQVLSIRPDVLPPPVMAELARLQDGIAPFRTSEARRVLEAELGQPVDAVFSEFAERPVAAASLAQVGCARPCTILLRPSVSLPAILASCSVCKGTACVDAPMRLRLLWCVDRQNG